MNKGLAVGCGVGESNSAALLNAIPANAIYCLLQRQTPINEKIHSSKLDGFLSFTLAIKLRLMWSRGESNSRPNKQLKNFLHAYFLFEFSTLG